MELLRRLPAPRLLPLPWRIPAAVLLAVAALLGAAAASPARQGQADLLEEFRQALLELPATDAKAQREREERLTRLGERLSLVELSRALVLPEWRYDDPNLDAAAADQRVFRRLAERLHGQLKQRM